jgi:hypothetical protein
LLFQRGDITFVHIVPTVALASLHIDLIIASANGRDPLYTRRECRHKLFIERPVGCYRAVVTENTGSPMILPSLLEVNEELLARATVDRLENWELR